ncbi:Rossmann-like and DUF2520 domain-containing protein [Rugosimonospora africana]|uniref:DUF2520 domain-containing protein n=1 Tax=Rugosimonospora africana TaxID=556532 RepID=A0A8J3VTX4_9ACTN|nr:Rossmann-like and DUF2520 domain-containing protein [Rugosimonospora africana]GIH18146.1 hypothetical protein Raf01_63180 [Rugosimonospora africana]
MGASTRVKTVGIVGAGRVGSALGAALASAGYDIIGASGRSAAAQAHIEDLLPGTPRLRPADVVAGAELVIFAVPDDVLAPLIAHLAESGAFRRPGERGPDERRPGERRPRERRPDDSRPDELGPGEHQRGPQVVAHTSGAHGVGVLHPAVAQGARPLALHPAMTFTGRTDDLARLKAGISFGVTAPADVRPLAETLVRDLGGTPEWIPEQSRALYHTALAHGANHLVTLVNDALDRLRDAGVRHPERVLDPLLHAALDNALQLGDAALTGPVSRGDAGTVSRHLDVLASTAPDALPAYLALARRTADRAIAAGRLGGAEAAPLLDALADAGYRSDDVPAPGTAGRGGKEPVA